MDRDQLLTTIDAAYVARQAGDTEALSRIWTEGSVFEIAGESSLIESFPGAAGPEDTRPAVEALIRMIEMRDVERIHAVVEGNKAATLSRATVSFAGRESFETLLYDLWEFDEAGKVSKLTQFADTAKVASELRALTQ